MIPVAWVIGQSALRHSDFSDLVGRKVTTTPGLATSGVHSSYICWQRIFLFAADIFLLVDGLLAPTLIETNGFDHAVKRV